MKHFFDENKILGVKERKEPTSNKTKKKTKHNL
jgi:hypothetical protein